MSVFCEYFKAQDNFYRYDMPLHVVKLVREIGRDKVRLVTGIETPSKVESSRHVDGKNIDFVTNTCKQKKSEFVRFFDS